MKVDTIAGAIGHAQCRKTAIVFQNDSPHRFHRRMAPRPISVHVEKNMPPRFPVFTAAAFRRAAGQLRSSV